ncbi:helix-turn-helix domain-containing protein [Nocardia sp. CY41]|uniref:helix-turn-helix domain-containing protein n=1 Tax=Nocardia sp. CY41 TaxID=2608686 RepID=UPI00135C2AEF|nr:helix-turn-helix transcriptional regulator [Nocardia sp. CY41]
MSPHLLVRQLHVRVTAAVRQGEQGVRCFTTAVPVGSSAVPRRPEIARSRLRRAGIGDGIAFCSMVFGHVHMLRACSRREARNGRRAANGAYTLSDSRVGRTSILAVGKNMPHRGRAGEDTAEMVGSKSDISRTTLPRRQLGRALRDARQANGYTLEQVAEVLEISRSSLGRLELGQNEKVKVRDIEFICQYYGLSEERTGYLKSLAEQARVKPWWEDFRDLVRPGFNTYIQLEAAATGLHFFQTLIIPGLLQTPDYARNVRPSASTGTSEETDWRVERRIRRSAILTRKHKPMQAEFLVHESALRTVVGSTRIMSSQYRHLADMGTRENISIRVVPFTAGFPGGLAVPPYIIIDFPDNEPSVVYTEGAIGTMIFEEEGDVNRFRVIHEAVKGAALEEQRSRDLLRNMARRNE